MKRTISLIFMLCSFTVNASVNAADMEKKTATCIACHGPKGISPNAEWPHLAGQHQQYLVKQLKNMKEGHERESPMMASIINQLTLEDIEALSTYYSQLPLAKGVTAKKFLKRGELIYRGGDFEKHITACIACHGPDGKGNEEAGFPVLSGQQVDYIVQQLKLFKEKKRKNDLNGIMRDISVRMDDDDMQAVAHYIAGLH